jgi:enterochelin esterase family protein
MKKLVVFLFALFLLQVHTYGQQAIFQGAPQIVSPEIHSDGSVTFRFQAPNAGEVRLTGDFLPPDGWMPGSVTMEKNAEGVWSYTTRPLSSDLYGYAFIVDGLRSMDPNNVYMIRDVASVTNVFIVPGGQGDYYSVNKVPHGTVLRTWYDSPSDQYEQKRRITIYTPPGYENGKDKYPVFYLLHGMGGDEEAWINLGRTSQILDNLIAAEKRNP